MSKAFSIAVALLIAATAVGAAQAKDPTAVDRIIAQEKAKGLVVQPSPRTAVQSIIAQEQGRHSDPRLFGPFGAAPIQVVGPPDGFDFGDAGIGGAAGLALALLAAAVALRNSSHRQRTGGAASAGG